MDIMDIYATDKGNESKLVIEAIKEIDDKLKDEKDGSKRTRLMFEQMLRGIHLTQDPYNVTGF